MYHLRAKRRKNYRELHNGFPKRKQFERTASVGDLSSADTLVDEGVEGLLEERGPEAQECISTEEDIEQHVRTSEDEEEAKISSEESEDEPINEMSETQDQCNTREECDIIPIAARQSFSRSSTDNSTPVISQTLQLPPSNNTKPIVRQEMTGLSIQRASTATINQVISFPIQSLRYTSTNKRRVHNPNVQSNQFHHHSSSSDSDSRSEADSRKVSGSVLKRNLRKALETEESFREEFGFGFDEFSMNPFDKPFIDPTSRYHETTETQNRKFSSWLVTSPYGIWVTKVNGPEPFAECKFENCGHKFYLQGNPTSSNIIRHFRRQHKSDYDLFQGRLHCKQKPLDSFSTVRSVNKKPFPFTKTFMSFLTLNIKKIHLLNVFIEGFIPFSFVETPVLKTLLNAHDVKGNMVISSRKGLVRLLAQFEEEFNQQLMHSLRYSHNMNLLLDMWTSTSQKSYLAVIVSFCPNLDRKSPLMLEDITTGRNPNTHILDFVDLSDERHTANNIKTALLRCLSRYSISHKIGSITLDNGSNNIAMLETLEKDLQKGIGTSSEGGLVKIRCMNHVLNRVFLDLLKPFENHYSKLLSRIDKLTYYLKSNVYMRGKVRSYIPLTIPKHNNTRFLSRHRQLEAFLKVSKGVKAFFFDNRFDPDYQLSQEDGSIFCYEQDEVDAILFFVRLTRIFQEFTMMLQDDSMNNLPGGIEYYLHINQYFEACEALENGLASSQQLQDIGLKQSHLSIPRETHHVLLSAVLSARSKFNKYRDIVYAEPGFWAAHILQPTVKTCVLTNSFDEPFQKEVLQSVDRYVNLCIQDFREKHLSSSNRTHLTSPTANSHGTGGNKFRVLRNLERSRVRNVAMRNATVRSEWLIYLDEPVETGSDYLGYWLSNKSRFPALCSLALSFYHTKLSTADVERCFSISKRVLENRFSLASENLRRTMIIRNRMKCFDLSSRMNKVKDLPLESWINEDEESDYNASDFTIRSGSQPGQIITIPSDDSSDNFEN